MLSPANKVGFFHERIKMDELDMKQLSIAVRAIADEKNLPEESVREVVEQAL